MTEQEVRKHIDDALKISSETTMVEFKTASCGIPKDTWESISSFSHKPGGGLVVLGVKELQNGNKRSFSITGVIDFSILQEQIGGLCNNEMNIKIRPDYFILNIENKGILAIYIPECPTQFKPCYYKPLGLPIGACVRDGNSNRKITDDEMRQFIENARLSKFDATRAFGTFLDDISLDKVNNLLIHVGQRTKRDTDLNEIDFELLKNLGIVDEFKEGKYPTIAGFLIFSKIKPQMKKDFSRYVIRCVRYKGSNVTTDIIDSMDIDGHIDTQIDSIEKFILRNIKKSAIIVGTKRIERYEYPEKATREIVANAIIHRDYKITETYTQVNIFEDRIEIKNPGCLPPGVTVENIRDAQVSRNQIIAARLKELDYLEEYGRGIDIVFNEMEKWNLIPPIFKNTTNSFKVILPGEKLSKLNERQLAIWNHLVENKKITAKICQETILTNIPRQTINHDLSRMQDLGLIHSIGKSVSTYYEANF